VGHPSFAKGLNVLQRAAWLLDRSFRLTDYRMA
jgi:hypothetical protein